jgi:ComF family protein
MGLLEAGRSMGRGMLDALLPPRCLTCEAAVSQQTLLCADCFRQISFIVDPACTRCGVPFAFGENRVCTACLAEPPVFAQARAALRYDARGRALVLPLKHADRIELAPVLARYMAQAGAALLDRADLLVPVPLHRRRLFERRYNQAALLVQALARISRRPAMLDALVRPVATPALEEKTAAERVATVAHAFAMRSGRSVLGRNVLLVDDVMTSGATANACATVLLAAGARAVDVLVAARVPDRREDG